MEVVDHLGVEAIEELEQGTGRWLRKNEPVAIGVVVEILAPVRRGRPPLRLVGEIDEVSRVPISVSVPPVGPEDRQNENDDFVTNPLECRVIADRQPVGELHHHFGTRGLRP